MVAYKLTLKLDSARGELKGGSSGEWQLSRGMVAVHEDGHGVQGFRELGFSFYKQANGGLTKRRCGWCGEGTRKAVRHRW